MPDPVEAALSAVRVSRDAELGAIGVLAPLGAAILLPDTGSTEFCVVRGDPGDGRVALSDCSTRGERFTCGQAPEGVSCVQVEGLARIEAPRLFMAWPIPDSVTPILDVFGALDLCVPIAGFGCVGPRPSGCQFGDTRTCQASCGATGVSFCNLLGWSACRAIAVGPNRFETCNGRDDDCDNRIDERTSIACSDFRSCNIDVCRAGTCEYEEPPGTCEGPTGPYPSCVTPVCGPAIALPGRRVERREFDCNLVLDDVSCDDGCDCNGPDRCSTRNRGPLGDGCAPRGSSSCENSQPDVDLCTVAICCSGNIEACATSRYRDPRQLRPDDIENAERACAYASENGLTFERPFDPADPNGPKIDCVVETEFSRLGRTYETYREIDCDYGVVCEQYEECIPARGICPRVQAAPDFTPCVEDRSGAPVPARNQCGIARCSGDDTGCTFASCPSATCNLEPLGDSETFECPATEVAPPPRFADLGIMVRPLMTTERDPGGAAVVYTFIAGEDTPFPGGEFRLQSCHVPSCSGNECTVDVDPSVCTNATGCLASRCLPSTELFAGEGLADPNGIIGCDVIEVDSNCPFPPDNECLTRDCQEDGTCNYIPIDARCSSSVPIGSECLVPDCGEENGQCGVRRDDRLCPFLTDCGSDLPRRFCRPDGNCAEDCGDLP